MGETQSEERAPPWGYLPTKRLQPQRGATITQTKARGARSDQSHFFFLKIINWMAAMTAIASKVRT